MVDAPPCSKLSIVFVEYFCSFFLYGKFFMSEFIMSKGSPGLSTALIYLVIPEIQGPAISIDEVGDCV